MRPPAILQIVREPLKPGTEATYQSIEEELARISASLGCPNPYLGAESLTGPKEVWWFNGYESPEDQKRVYDDYAKNTRLLGALTQSSAKKAGLTLQLIETFAQYRHDLSDGTPWAVGDGRFLVITMTMGNRLVGGTVFESFDGMRYIVSPAQTRDEANRISALAGPETRILAVRPSWSFPAKEWIEADPQFWRAPY